MAPCSPRPPEGWRNGTPRPTREPCTRACREFPPWTSPRWSPTPPDSIWAICTDGHLAVLPPGELLLGGFAGLVSVFGVDILSRSRHLLEGGPISGAGRSPRIELCDTGSVFRHEPCRRGQHLDLRRLSGHGACGHGPERHHLGRPARGARLRHRSRLEHGFRLQAHRNARATTSPPTGGPSRRQRSAATTPSCGIPRESISGFSASSGATTPMACASTGAPSPGRAVLRRCQGRSRPSRALRGPTTWPRPPRGSFDCRTGLCPASIQTGPCRTIYPTPWPSDTTIPSTT
jgi:hypothetical protein